MVYTSGKFSYKGARLYSYAYQQQHEQFDINYNYENYDAHQWRGKAINKMF